MDQYIEEALRPIIDGYSEQRNKRELPAPVPERQKDLCLNVIEARMEVLERNSADYGECAFLRGALKNGWLVSDVDALSAFWQALPQIPEPYRSEGEFYLRQIASLPMEKLIDRFETLNRVNTFLFDAKYQNPDIPALKDAFAKIHLLQKTPVFPAEYPKDPEFSAVAGTDDLQAGVSYEHIFADMQRLARYRSAAEERRRTVESYTIQEGGEAEEAGQPFAPGWGHRVFGGITKQAGAAIREAFGSEVYDEIREMGRGSLGERTVPLHHALGTKYQKQGSDVLEMEFAGSGAEDVYREHKERRGKIDLKDKSPKDILETYGEKVQKPNGKGKFDFIWKKVRRIDLPDGQSATKLRYTFAGVSPTTMNGIFNFGDYSIESSRDNACAFARRFLEERFDDWLRNPEHRRPIHLNLSGHSRGAVTAGQAAVKIDEWVREYIRTHEGAEQFRDLLHYDLVLRDPVAGFGSDLRFGDCDLRKIPNVNVTVFASMGVQAPDKILPLQYVQGVKRLILTTTDHLIDVTGTDDSQKMRLGNDKTGHMVSYFDAETGEMHRGSGISELPDGIYVADEKHRLIRMTSYSQVNELFRSVFENSTAQATRSERIHKMVRDWFCENELQMSFPDERTRRMAEARNDWTQGRLLQIKSKRMAPIQAEIETLELLKRKNPTKEALIAQNRKLIEACRTYMKETGMPPSGNSARKLGLVGDALSYAMRENNQLSKELRLSKGEVPDSPLDEKIRAYRERLERKDGSLEGKLALERKRFVQEQKLLAMIEATAKTCGDALALLDATRGGKRSSDSCERLHKLLKAGTKLDAQLSVNELKEFLKRFTKASEDYRRSHDSLIGPLTKDGQRRLTESRNLTAFGKTVDAELKKLSAELGDNNAPIGLRVAERASSLKYLEQRREALRGAEPQRGVDPERQPAPAEPGLREPGSGPKLP